VQDSKPGIFIRRSKRSIKENIGHKNKTLIPNERFVFCVLLWACFFLNNNK